MLLTGLNAAQGSDPDTIRKVARERAEAWMLEHEVRRQGTMKAKAQLMSTLARAVHDELGEADMPTSR